MFLGKLRDKPMLQSDIDYYGSNQSWKDALETDPFTLIEKLKTAGLVTPLTPKYHAKIMLDAFTTVAQLKEALEKTGAKKTGKKSDLIDRLIESDEDVTTKLIPEEACWGTTEKGAEIVDNYRLKKKAEKEDLEDKLLAFILDKMHSQAAQLRAEYNSRQVFPPGLGCDWNDWNIQRDANILNAVRELTPDVFTGMSSADLGPARITASLQHLYGAHVSERLRNKILSSVPIITDEKMNRLEFQARQLLNFAYGKTNLEEWKAMSFAFIKISCSGEDSCTACRQISLNNYPIAQAPELPLKDCTETRGCRCCYVAA